MFDSKRILMNVVEVVLGKIMEMFIEGLKRMLC